MHDKKALRVTGTTEANMKFTIHTVQTAVKDTVNRIFPTPLTNTMYHMFPGTALPLKVKTDKYFILCAQIPVLS